MLTNHLSQKKLSNMLSKARFPPNSMNTIIYSIFLYTSIAITNVVNTFIHMFPTLINCFHQRHSKNLGSLMFALISINHSLQFLIPTLWFMILIYPIQHHFSYVPHVPAFEKKVLQVFHTITEYAHVVVQHTKLYHPNFYCKQIMARKPQRKLCSWSSCIIIENVPPWY